MECPGRLDRILLRRFGSARFGSVRSSKGERVDEQLDSIVVLDLLLRVGRGELQRR